MLRFKLEVLDFQPHLFSCAEFVNEPDKFVITVNATVNIKHRNNHKHCRYQYVQLSISRTQVINDSLQDDQRNVTLSCVASYFVRAGRHKHEKRVKQFGFSCLQSLWLVCSFYYSMLYLLSKQNFTGTFPRTITLITNPWSVICCT